jgi:curli biogenesis system outer membrane secretion channel CsgG
MVCLSKRPILNVLILASALFFLFSCSSINQIVHPDEKPAPSTWPTYEQVLKDNYKGPKARVTIPKFVDKSPMGTETSRIGDGMAEMLRNALLATNHYIIQIRSPLDDVVRGQDSGDGGRLRKEGEPDLLVEGEIREFNSSIPGAGDETGGASYVAVTLTVSDLRTKQVLATHRVNGKATDFGGTSQKVGGPLPEVFRGFSKTLMEKAIRITIEESASFVVAKTPPEYYRVVTVNPPRESSKIIPVSPKVTPPPSPPPPPRRMTQVIVPSENLRDKPQGKVIRKVDKGTSLTILEVEEKWLRVRLEDGTEAWIWKSATSEAPKPTPKSTPKPAPTPPAPSAPPTPSSPPPSSSTVTPM